MLNNEVGRYIATHHLLRKADRHIVALSGGADSVCLLLVLRSLGYTAEAAHCNFHLRGDESNRDEQFCIALCRRLDVPLHLAHFDTHAYASLHKVSIEMAARDLRYAYFEQLRHDLDAATICVAHHRDDNAETMLLNLIRGTGIDGLTGMAPKHGHVVRPLLAVSRQQILDYLRHLGQDYVTDSSNLVDDVKRNKLRLHVIPLLQTINPSIVDTLCQTASRLAEAASMANAPVLHEAFKGNRLSVALLWQQPSVEFTLWHRLAPLGFTSAQVGDMVAAMDSGSGRQWTSADYVVVKDRDGFIIDHREPSAPRPMVVPEEGTYVFSPGYRFGFTIAPIGADFILSRDARCVMLDAQRVRFPLTIRRVVPGDRFVPLGMKGSKLVSDYLTDRKRNIIEKQRQLVVTDADGRIVWLVGERPDERFRISDASENYLEISWKQ